MGFFLDHWYGRLSVGRAVWLSGFVAILMCLPASLVDTYAFFNINHINGIQDLMVRAQNGDVNFVEPPLFLRALEEISDCLSLIWWSVGTWRSTQRPNVQGVVEGYWFLKFTIIATALYEVYDVFDFIKDAFTS